MMKILKYGVAIMVILAAVYFLVIMIFAGVSLVLRSNVNTVASPVSTPAITANENIAPVVQPAKINKPVEVVENLNKVILTVPYINESPDNTWTGPWKNACEEACITMVDKYYYGLSTVSIPVAKKEMSMLFEVQNELWGGNADSDAARTARMINENTIYNAIIIEKPTILQIQKELQGKRPVIVPLYGFDLHNPNIPFVPAPRGTSYHMIVIVGYDDVAKEFIANDPGDIKQGSGHRYSYEILMNAIHDYSYVTKHADGPARAIFTYPKLVKSADNPNVYYLYEQIKQYIPNEEIFKARGWTWDAVNVVTQEWLDAFKMGEDVK